MNQRFLKSESAGSSLSTRSAEPSRPEEAHESLAAEYLRTFSRHKKLIAATSAAGLALALLSGIMSPPLYRTRTSLDIRSVNNDFMNMRSVSQTGDGSAEEANTNLQTQIKLLQSDTLLEQVKARLLTQLHPETIPREDALSRIERALHLGGTTPISYEAILDDASKRVKVKPIGLTRLVEITCDSWNAQFSATFCNTVTSTFHEEDLQTRSNEATQTSEWLTRQLADVRQKAQESQKRLQDAVGGNGLMLSQTPQSAGEDRMRSLQDELVKAQADRMQKEANSSVARSAPADTLPEVQDNPAHRAYELRLADLEGQLSALVPKLTEQNPKVILLRSQIAQAEAGLLATSGNSTSRQNNELAAARHREDLLRAAFNAQQSTVSSDLQKAAQVSLLRRELESEQQLYQTLLQRAKEAGFATALQASTIRVVDTAEAPKVAFSPQPKLAGGVGLALGALLGTLIAFFKDRNNKVFRGPGDVSRYLQVPELGVIPALSRIAPPRSSALTLKKQVPLSPIEGYGDAVSLTRWSDTFSIAAEAYRNATMSILLSDSSKRAHSYVVSSPGVGEGKTTVTSNLGVALSKSRLRVVLIDGDLRRPNLHNAFALPNKVGLRDILRGDIDLEKTPTQSLTTATGLANLSIIPAGNGREDVVELLHSSYFGALLARLSRDFDIILVDSPPTLHMADARILAGQSDGAILIFRAGLTTREQALQSRDLFDQDGVRLVGTILNDFDPVREGKAGYYGGYYSYQQRAEAEKVGAGV